MSVTQPGPKYQKIVYVDPGYNDDPKIENREGKKGLLAMNGMNVAKGAKQ